MLKRVISALLAAVVLLFLVGCGKTNTINELAASGDLEEIYAAVTTVAECQQFLLSSGIKEGSGNNIEAAFTEKSLRANRIMLLCCKMLAGDYEEVGWITTTPNDNYFFLCVKENDTYYLSDILFVTQPGVVLGAKTFEAKSKALDDLLETAANLRGDLNANYTRCDIAFFESPDGRTFTGIMDCGVPTIDYAGTTVPLGLGFPKLTDEEIDALLAENDPCKVKETITTLADFANYCYRGDFIMGDGLIAFYPDDGHPSALITSSGYQTLLRRQGQCASMSSCLHYVLADDYEEIGYVDVDGHVMTYILCDGLYYLVNPVEYVTIVYEGNHRGSGWLDGLQREGKTYCSANFQDIADSLYGSPLSPDKPSSVMTFVYTCVSPGDYVCRGDGEYPEGTTGTRWYGDNPVKYFQLTYYDWISQESIVDEICIVQYIYHTDPIFTFTGRHEDPYTGKVTSNRIEDVPQFDCSDDPDVISYLKEIGAITFTNAEKVIVAETGDLGEIGRAITTAEDCVRLLVASGIKEGDNDSLQEAFAKKSLRSEKIVELACKLLDSDYEEVGVITTKPDHYLFLYVKQDGVYTIHDVLKATRTGQGVSGVTFYSSDDMTNYAVTERNGNEAVIKAWPW